MRTTPSDDIEAIADFAMQVLVGAHIALACFAIIMLATTLVVGAVTEVFKAKKTFGMAAIAPRRPLT